MHHTPRLNGSADLTAYPDYVTPCMYIPCCLDKQWLELDLGPPTLVTGILTRGRGDKKNWVTSYTLSYSNDTNIWFYYKDANHLEAKVGQPSAPTDGYEAS